MYGNFVIPFATDYPLCLQRKSALYAQLSKKRGAGTPVSHILCVTLQCVFAAAIR